MKFRENHLHNLIPSNGGMKTSLDTRYLQGVERNYINALALLNSRRRDQRPGLQKGRPDASTLPNLMPDPAGKSALRGRPSLEGMKEWLKQLGHSESELKSLNVIHVAGTKGKGSTCAFINSFLDVHRERTGFPKRIGMYTSPHLKTIRERIQIDSAPISKDLFAQYVFEVWEGLSSSTYEEKIKALGKPRYLQLLALLSMHIFIKEQVDAAIYETHSGGEYDATNVFSNPAATGITTIGMDHVEQLGPSIQNISWHKAGIMKHGSPAFSSPQVPEAAKILQQRATDKGVKLSFVTIDSSLPLDAPNLKPEAQKVNCSLSLTLAASFLMTCAPKGCQDLNAHDIVDGIKRFSWIGRYHRITDGTHHWYLDGAHNLMSIEKVAHWFADNVAEASRQKRPTRILIFSHTSDRDGTALLTCLAKLMQEKGIELQYVIFSTYEETQDITSEIDKTIRYPDRLLSKQAQQDYVRIYSSIDPETTISVQPTIEQALNEAKEIGDRNGGMETLITGSLYLVGGALRLLEPDSI